MRRLSLLVPMLILALCATAQAKPALGIADQKPDTFLDRRLDDLHLRYSRLYVPWDVLQDKNSLHIVDAWLAGSKLANLDPLITISRSRIPSRKSENPTPAKLAGEFKKWRKRWPGQMSTISTWNEANLGKKPEMVAQWWLALRRACPTCTILGADLLDEPKVLTWAAAFVKAAKRSPTVWGLHAYNDANTFTTNSTKALLKSLKGDIWLTETGGVANRVNPSYKFAGCGVAFQTKATTFLLKKIAMLSPRIKRIYLFNWGLGDGGASFDSALVDAKGRERPSLNLVRTYLGLARIPSPIGGYSPELSRCKKGTATIKTPKAPPKTTATKKT
ncbi:MAG: hypothetical protein JWO02_1054 [Solirubrobacterales bacterium]|nr:hypothetical protein [Solirubrobacterales bacterium]